MEVSVLRNEDKFLINPIEFSSLKKKLGIILSLDKHSDKEGYMVRSLYFDSINNIDLNTKLAGNENRKKIRIRVYTPEEQTCKLEMKQKFGNLQNKISLTITREDAIALTHLDYSVLIKYFDTSEYALQFYTTMQLGCYQPVVMIEYDRIAYTYPEYDTRITLDCNIRSSESNFDLFDPHIMYVPLSKYETVLEVKYNKHLLQFISDTLAYYDLTQIAVSKYVLGRKAFIDFNY